MRALAWHAQGVVSTLVGAAAALGLGDVLTAVLDLGTVLLPLGEADAYVPVVVAVLPPPLVRQALDGLVRVVRLGEPAHVSLGDAQVQEAQA